MSKPVIRVTDFHAGHFCLGTGTGFHATPYVKGSLNELTNQIIGLLQNTSLMAILGLVELLGITRSLLANPNYIGGYMEAYLWIGLIYWISCTIVSALFRKLEFNLSYNINKSESK